MLNLMRAKSQCKLISPLLFSNTWETRHLSPGIVNRTQSIRFHSNARDDACESSASPLQLPVKDEATLYLHVSIALTVVSPQSSTFFYVNCYFALYPFAKYFLFTLGHDHLLD